MANVYNTIGLYEEFYINVCGHFEAGSTVQYSSNMVCDSCFFNAYSNLKFQAVLL